MNNLIVPARGIHHGAVSWLSESSCSLPSRSGRPAYRCRGCGYRRPGTDACWRRSFAWSRLRRNTVPALARGVAVGIVAVLGLATPAQHMLNREHTHPMRWRTYAHRKAMACHTFTRIDSKIVR